MEHQNRMGRRLQIRKVKTYLRFPSLFSRLVCIFISILVIMLIVVFITFTNFFHSYFVKYTLEIMTNQAKGIVSEYQKALHYGIAREEAVSQMISRIEVMNTYLEGTTWITDQEGQGYMIDSKSCEIMSEKINLEPYLDEIFKGEIVAIENGFKESFSKAVLSIGYPVMRSGQVQYALFIHIPMSYILQTINEVRVMIFSVMGFVGSVAFIWIYLLSKQMTRPLKEMSQVAKSIASGEFDKRIKVNGNDEIAQLGLALNHMAEALDRIEENRRSFIANISHDLRSPLTSIQGFVTAILDGTIDAEYQERYLKIVLSESKRLITMSNTILELNQVQEGMRPIKKVPLNMNQMIEEAVLTLEDRRKKKNVHVITQLDERHAWVVGDIDGVSRVIQNLLDNAFKFVGQNGHIMIRTKLKQEKLWISVLNDGPSIPPKQQKLIWDRFYKGDGSRGQDKKGVGLGLVIVKEILKQHDETIHVYSEEDKMVEFRFSLPIACQSDKLKGTAKS